MMLRTLCGALGAAAWLAVAPAWSQQTLTICLDENLPPYSVAEGAGRGFDVAVSQALAKHLGRTLAIQWFESKLDEDKSTTLETNALLSDGRCDLVAGYPLVRDALGKPGSETARLPDFRGAVPADRRRRVTMGTLVPTEPYHRAPFTIVLSANAAGHKVAGLADLDGLTLGVEGGTLSDAILMLYRGGRYVDKIVHFAPGRGELLVRMEKGEFDATIIALHRFDVYRAAHPETRIVATNFFYPIAFNMGFVGLSTNAALIAEVNHALLDMRANGELEKYAHDAGMTYVAPVAPAVLEHFTLANLEH